ncbi:hypothetical protein GGF32_007295 [Allomyces javanicus]|nr:hypothetical protein GGF32_007295 [Allomyces javanicus]
MVVLFAVRARVTPSSTAPIAICEPAVFTAGRTPRSLLDALVTDASLSVPTRQLLANLVGVTGYVADVFRGTVTAGSTWQLVAFPAWQNKLGTVLQHCGVVRHMRVDHAANEIRFAFEPIDASLMPTERPLRRATFLVVHVPDHYQAMISAIRQRDMPSAVIDMTRKLAYPRVNYAFLTAAEHDAARVMSLDGCRFGKKHAALRVVRVHEPTAFLTDPARITATVRALVKNDPHHYVLPLAPEAPEAPEAPAAAAQPTTLPLVPFRAVLTGGTVLHFVARPHWRDRVAAVFRAWTKVENVRVQEGEVRMAVSLSWTVVDQVMRESGAVLGGMLLDFEPVVKSTMVDPRPPGRAVFLVVGIPRKNSHALITALDRLDLPSFVLDDPHDVPGFDTSYAFLSVTDGDEAARIASLDRVMVTTSTKCVPLYVRVL